MKYAYYHSCSLRSTGKEYHRSLVAVCSKLDIELVEMEEWVCCGSTIAHNVSRLLSLALPLKNLAEIEKSGFNEVVVPCTACYSRFKIAQYEIAENPKLAAEVEDIIEYRFKDGVKVYHPLEILSSEPVLSRMTQLVKKDLSHLKVVSYYGCLLVRPPKMTKFADDCEYPVTMDRVLSAVGITTLDWSHKTECCGGSLALTKLDVAIRLTNTLLENAAAAGADAIALPCTFCHLNLDTHQGKIKKKYGVSYDLPIFYFTELVGLALGISEKELLLNKHFVDTRSILKKVT